MKTVARDDRIADLYQLPLAAFTAARNTLAKELADEAIKKLEKPNLAVWAVNQLYWHERELYDDVVKTSGQVRTAHKLMLGGKAADVKAAEVFHNEAMRKAKDAIRRILAAAGNTSADAVMTPVTETLDALPADPPGRLTKPLRRTGFEALQGVTIAARPAVAKVAPSFANAAAGKPNAGSDKDAEKDRRKRGADQQELLMAKERLRFAEAAEREAEASLDRARRTLERAERTRERVEGELDEAVAAEKMARKELASSEAGHNKATAERERLRKKTSA